MRYTRYRTHRLILFVFFQGLLVRIISNNGNGKNKKHKRKSCFIYFLEHVWKLILVKIYIPYIIRKNNYSNIEFSPIFSRYPILYLEHFNFSLYNYHDISTIFKKFLSNSIVHRCSSHHPP